MQFSVSKKHFLTALQKLQRVLPTKPQLPVLAAIHICVQQESLLLTATDLYLGMQVLVQATIKTPGSLVVPGKLLLSAIASFPEGEIVVQQKNNTLSLVSTATKITLQTLASDEYPEFP